MGISTSSAGRSRWSTNGGGIAVNVGKGPMFSLKDRVAMCRKEVAAMKLNGTLVDVVPSQLLMDFVTSQGADLIIRGCARFPTLNTSSRWRA